MYGGQRALRSASRYRAGHKTYMPGWCELVAVLLSIPPDGTTCGKLCGPVGLAFRPQLFVPSTTAISSEGSAPAKRPVLGQISELRKQRRWCKNVPATTHPAAPPPTMTMSTSRGGSLMLVFLSPGILAVWSSSISVCCEKSKMAKTTVRRRAKGRNPKWWKLRQHERSKPWAFAGPRHRLKKSGEPKFP